MTVYTSPFGDFDEELTSNNHGLLLRSAWAKNGRTTFTDAVSGLSYTGSDLAKLSKILVNSLHAVGLRAGDIVSICCLNTVRTPLLLSAIWSLNAVGSGLDFGFSADEYQDLTSVYEPRAFVCVKQNLSVALQVREASSSIKWIIVLDDDSENRTSSTESLVFSFGYLCVLDAKDAPEIEVQPDILAYMPRTSGTTGRSKAAMHTHRTLNAGVLMQSAPDVMPFDSDIVVLSTSALHHVYCLFDVFASCSYRGFHFVHSQSNDAEIIMHTIERYKVSAFFTTPYIVLSMLNLFKTGSEICGKVSLRSLKVLVTASNVFPEDSLAYLRQCLPDLECFGNLYGQTEITAAFSHPFRGFHKCSAIGQVLSRGKFRIVDPNTLEDLPVGSRGELLVKLPDQMIGYYKDPDAFEKSMVQDKWYRTGDICIVDDEGFVFLVDRLKEFIKTKFTTISPGEVEAKILQHPLVKDVAVLGLPHPILQNALHAIIVPNSSGLDADAIHQFLAEKAPDIYKLEGGITFCEAIPRSDIGKLVRRNLLRWVLDRVTDSTPS
ncbi:4-coumarate--CoA ligase-like 6 [Galendromus occidentalis]|uniref:4-coumarate--CoA ligase-like 6 n=1 Tax=Galendromus occidentalis TaxID=34638 RepID=A0AAJ6QNQ5_9ACAR|nr:4-coumarate--CoA ligase-like 6 [Galendromus occidentalis]